MTLITLPLSEDLDLLDNAIIDSFRRYFPAPAVRTVELFQGDWGDDQIRKYGKKANAVIVSRDGGKASLNGGMLIEQSVFNVYIMTNGEDVAKRNRAMSIIYERALKIVHLSNPWSGHGAIVPESCQGKNLFSKSLDDMQLSLWMLRFEMRTHLPYMTAAQYDSLDDFATAYSTFVNPGTTAPSILEDNLELPTE